MSIMEDAYSTGYEDGVKSVSKRDNEMPVTRYDNCGNYSASWRCPVCYEMAIATYNKHSFCQYCGQKLDWKLDWRDR